MAKEYNFIEYTKETAEAIRKARDLPTRGDGQSPWAEHPRQQLLPPMMTNAEGVSVQKHPFDVELVTGGTEESPTYSVRVFNSALPDSPYAGIVYIGTATYSVPVDELTIEAGEGDYFAVDLVVTYDAENSPVYTLEFEVRTDSDYEDPDNVFRQTIAEGVLPEIASVVSGNITVLGRWV